MTFVSRELLLGLPKPWLEFELLSQTLWKIKWKHSHHNLVLFLVYIYKYIFFFWSHLNWSQTSLLSRTSKPTKHVCLCCSSAFIVCRNRPPTLNNQGSAVRTFKRRNFFCTRSGSLTKRKSPLYKKKKKKKKKAWQLHVKFFLSQNAFSTFQRF